MKTIIFAAIVVSMLSCAANAQTTAQCSEMEDMLVIMQRNFEAQIAAFQTYPDDKMKTVLGNDDGDALNELLIEYIAVAKKLASKTQDARYKSVICSN